MSGLDFEIVANNDVTVQISVYNADGTSKDLTGFSGKWGIYKPGTSAAVVSKTTSSGMSFASNVITITISAADTASLLGDNITYKYIHEGIVTDGSGNDVTITNSDVSWGYMTLRKQYQAQ